MQAPIVRRIIACLGMAFLVSIFVAIFDSTYISAPLFSLVVMRTIASRGTSRLWAGLVCLVAEMNSPFPGLVYGISILVAYFFLEIYILRFVSRQAFLGIFTGGVLAAFLLQLMILVLTFFKIGSPAGWIPDFSWVYWLFFLKRGVLTAILAAAVTVLGIRLYSPRLRGIVIANS